MFVLVIICLTSLGSENKVNVFVLTWRLVDVVWPFVHETVFLDNNCRAVSARQSDKLWCTLDSFFSGEVGHDLLNVTQNHYTHVVRFNAVGLHWPGVFYVAIIR